jgi:hypothetical protein
VSKQAVYAFEVGVKGTDWTGIVNARTAGQAKSWYHRQVTEAWPSIPYTAITCRKVGAPESSEGFVRNAEYRGVPHVRCGQRVLVCGKARGVIVGHNGSANFDVLFDADSPLYPNVRGNVHPAECQFIDEDVRQVEAHPQ